MNRRSFLCDMVASVSVVALAQLKAEPQVIFDEDQPGLDECCFYYVEDCAWFEPLTEAQRVAQEMLPEAPRGL